MSLIKLKSVIGRCVLIILSALLLRALFWPASSSIWFQKRKHFWMPSSIVSADFSHSIRKDKFLEVPQIIWGLNNQKIAFARACLTARFLNRTLLMPSLSASLFYKEVDLLQPISFDNVFDFKEFNNRCRNFVRLGRYSDLSNSTEPFELQKGSGRKWTSERDWVHLREAKESKMDRYEVIKIIGKHPFLWPDHWPVTDYSKVFNCLVLVPDIQHDVCTIISKINKAGSKMKNGSDLNQKVPPGLFSASYMAVHMRIEIDWMIHCKKWEQRSGITEICSNKQEIMERVKHVTDMRQPAVVYLAVADKLLEDESILTGWASGLVPYEKKMLGVLDIYAKHPYLIQSAIDFEICCRAEVFVGNSFSTFSSLVVLSRTQRIHDRGAASSCGRGYGLSSYAYNILGDSGAPRRWMADMSAPSLVSVSYGTNNISCHGSMSR